MHCPSQYQVGSTRSDALLVAKPSTSGLEKVMHHSLQSQVQAMKSDASPLQRKGGKSDASPVPKARNIDALHREK
jgi:hypothetical protein